MATKGEQTRQEIIGAAKTLFYLRGYASTSFSDIVDKTGIQRGNIYHYFKTKDEILNAVIEKHVAEYQATLSNWENEYADPKDRLLRFVKMVASNKGQLARYGCPIGTLSAELGKESCDFQETARSLFDVFIEWLTEQFHQLGKKKKARPLALHLLGRTEGISVMAHVYGDPNLVTAEIKILQEWLAEV